MINKDEKLIILLMLIAYFGLMKLNTCTINNSDSLYRVKKEFSVLNQSTPVHTRINAEKGKKEWLGRNKVIHFNQTSWSLMDDHICDKKNDFLLGHIKLKKRRKKIPIFLHQWDKDVHISRVILNGGSWENELLDKMINVMAKYRNATFIDIGAHVGVYSLTIASFGYRVIAIDCLRENIERLCASFRRQGLAGNTSIVYNALSSERKVVYTKPSSELNVGSNFIVSDGSTIKTTKEQIDNHLQSVQAIRLDDLIEIFNIKSAVLKVDVEGHEDHVLMGAEKFFRTVKVVFVQMEFHTHKERKSGKFIQNFMDRNGLVPELPNHISVTNLTQWPYNVQWKIR